MRRTLSLGLVLLVVAAAPPRQTTMAARFRGDHATRVARGCAGVFTIGVPSGRAWRIESELRALPPERALAVRLSVGDEAVREDFARVPHDASASGRSRPIATADSEGVARGEGRVLFMARDPPPGGVD